MQNLSDFHKKLLTKISYKGGEFGAKVYLVGGAVRDLLMGRGIKDLDLLVEGEAIAFCRYMEEGGLLEIKSVHKDFGTVKTLMEGANVDFASTREEEYPASGCLPVVENIGCSVQKDALRRDFTINAIYMDISSHQIIDPLGGREDLKCGLLRITHPESFRDDPTRILRALDFELRFGFKLEESTKKAKEEYLKNPPDRSGMSLARVELTLKKLLRNPAASRIIMQEGLWKVYADKPTLPEDFAL